MAWLPDAGEKMSSKSDFRRTLKLWLKRRRRDVIIALAFLMILHFVYRKTSRPSAGIQRGSVRLAADGLDRNMSRAVTYRTTRPVAGIRQGRVRFPANALDPNKYWQATHHTYSLKRQPIQYCYIPKTNCRTMKRVVRKREGHLDWKDSSRVHRENGLRLIMDHEARESEHRLFSPKYFKFVIVRDPFARFISAYLNKIHSFGEQREKFWNSLQTECPQLVPRNSRMPLSGPLLTISQFVQCVTSVEHAALNEEHWRPQTMFCALDSVPYDRYIFFEDFNDEIPDLLNTLGWEEDLDLFKLDKKPTIQKSIESFFTQDDVKRLVRHYKDDFEILGYPKIPKGYMGFYSHAEHLREIFHTKNE